MNSNEKQSISSQRRLSVGLKERSAQDILQETRRQPEASGEPTVVTRTDESTPPTLLNEGVTTINLENQLGKRVENKRQALTKPDPPADKRPSLDRRAGTRTLLGDDHQQAQKGKRNISMKDRISKIQRRFNIEKNHNNNNNNNNNNIRNNVTESTNNIIFSKDAEKAMNYLAMEKLHLRNAFSVLNLSVLKNRFKCEDIYPIVQTNLVRDQDRLDGIRVDLAQKIRWTLSKNMRQEYTGSPKSSKLVLLIRITVVSDGTRYFERVAGMMGKAGQVKLTISYCLFSRETGKVAVAKQFNYCDDREDVMPEKLLMKFADGIQWKLNREVKFIACSRLKEWPGVAKGVISGTEKTDYSLSMPSLGGIEA